MKNNTNDGGNHFGLLVANKVIAMLSYWDYNLVCRFANDAHLTWFGKTKDEMINVITLPLLLGPLYEQTRPYILAALDGHSQTFEREIIIQSGETRYTITNYLPNYSESKVIGFFVHIADVTPIKLLGEELASTNEIINNQNKRLLNFANIVSHNLKTYAFNLKEILDILKQSDSDAEKNEMVNYLDEISIGFSSTVINLEEIVSAQNLAQLPHQEINLNEYLKRTIQTLGIIINNSSTVIINKLSSNVMINANPAFVESILLNLMTNAIKYKHPDRDAIIKIEAIKTDKELMLHITDNGRGINLHKHKNDIFGMYKTFHSNPDAKGIGLFITKYQVEAMGGKITVKSNEEKGTTFSISFKP